nr:uncharacterized protein LOC116428342 isoform X2 [Nomia melanderi]
MEHTTETKFSDYLIEKRFKKLERALKIATLRKGHTQEGDESWALPMSPSISSINADAFDSGINVPCLQASKTGSEVISSCKNFRNMVLEKKDIRNNRSNICTSSVKKFSNTNDSEKDYFMKPPLNFKPPSCASKKLNSTSVSNTARTISTFQDNSSDVDKQSPKRNILGSLQISSNEIIQNRKVRVFSQWKVALNEQGQLIIQGIIDRRQIARSKPILRRLTSREVQSVFKHIYQLKGDIVDEGNELPDYIRGKFCNGFPDDWENVHQIWRTFVHEGFKPTFRWPTPLADSDDDLRSEVTDITYTGSMHMSHVDSVLETNKSNEYFKSPTRRMNNSFTQTCMSDVIENNQQNYFDEEHQKQLTNAVAKCSYNDNKTNKLKDKLNIIVNNLTDRNCPQEFVTKIVEIFDCLSYVVSYGSVKENESNMETSTSVQDKGIIQEQENNTCTEPFSSDSVIDCNKSKCKNTTTLQNRKYPETTEHIITKNKSTACNELPKAKTPIKMNSREDKDTSDSESEIYAGVPKISAQRILQQRETFVKPYKRKSRTRVSQQRCDIVEKEHASNVPLVTPKNFNYTYAYDSSVSIIGDVVESPNNKDIANYDVEGSICKNVNPGKTPRKQQEGSNVFSKEISARGMQEHSSRVNSTSIYRPSENLSDSFGINKSNVQKMNRTSENKKEMTETSVQNGTPGKHVYNAINEHQQEVSNEQFKEPSSYQLKDVTNNISKPVVISSVPVNVTSMHTEVKQVKDTNRNIKKAEKEARLVEETSPLKTPNAFRDINSVSLIDDNQEELEESKKSLQEDRICDDKPNEDDTKVNMLSGWTPNVICDPALCLIFEGRLVNDAGHIVDRKFRTDAVLRRVSQKLVETVSHKFYQLVGDLNDIKHVIPKSLINQCRKGCPTRIEQFCKIWKSLKDNEQNSSNLDRSVDDMNIRISSKGRRIVPALHYWTGERVILKNDNPVYIPGSPQDSLESINKSLNKAKGKKTKKGESNSKKRSLEELKNSSANSANRSSNNRSTENTRQVENTTRKGGERKKIKRIVEGSDSSDSSDCKKSPAKKEPFNSTRTINKFDGKVVVNGENSRKHQLDDGETKLISSSTKLKTRSSGKLSAQVGDKQTPTNQYAPPTENCYTEECLYYKNFRQMDDTLSEDQESHV